MKSPAPSVISALPLREVDGIAVEGSGIFPAACHQDWMPYIVYPPCRGRRPVGCPSPSVDARVLFNKVHTIHDPTTGFSTR